MKYLAIAALAAGLITAPAAALAASRTFELEAFTAVDISSGINAEITVGPAQSVRAESPRQDELDELIVEVRNGKLTARTDWNLLELFTLGDRQTTLFITVPALVSAEASSGASVDVTGIAGDEVTLESSSGADIDARAAAGKTFKLEVSSGAGIDVEGACGNARARLSSGATLDAEGLECTDVEVEASSGATARIFASASVKAEASSGAAIEVHGRPAKVEQDQSSGGDIELKD